MATLSGMQMEAAVAEAIPAGPAAGKACVSCEHTYQCARFEYEEALTEYKDVKKQLEDVEVAYIEHCKSPKNEWWQEMKDGIEAELEELNKKRHCKTLMADNRWQELGVYERQARECTHVYD